MTKYLISFPGEAMVPRRGLRDRLNASHRPSLLDPEVVRNLQVRTGASVVLFSDSLCEWCAKARELLEQRHVVFKELYIDRSQEAHELFLSITAAGVPVLVVGRTRGTGYSKQEMELASKTGSLPQ